MENPDFYTNKFNLLPSKLPRFIALQTSTVPQFGGHCPVSYFSVQGRQKEAPYEGIVKAAGDFCAEYDGKVYSMETADKLALFMR